MPEIITLNQDFDQHCAGPWWLCVPHLDDPEGRNAKLLRSFEDESCYLMSGHFAMAKTLRGAVPGAPVEAAAYMARAMQFYELAKPLFLQFREPDCLETPAQRRKFYKGMAKLMGHMMLYLNTLEPLSLQAGKEKYPHRNKSGHWFGSVISNS